MFQATSCGIVSSTSPIAKMRGTWPACCSRKAHYLVPLIDIESHYAWKGAIRDQPEVMLLAKTRL